VTDALTVLNKLATGPQVAIERAAGELRAGRPILIDTPAGLRIAAALDGVSPSVFAALRELGGRLALSGRRALALGLNGDYPVSVLLTQHTLESALTLATGIQSELGNWLAGDETASAAIGLCKHALLLPAALIAQVPENEAANLVRVKLEDLTPPTGDRDYDLEIVSEAEVPLTGNVQTRFVVLRGGSAPRDQVAIVIGKPDPTKPVPVRMHSACLTGDLFGSLRCDCGDQLRNAVARLNAAGGGVLLYLDQEGRGIGIGNKMRAYALQDEGFDTIDADRLLGFGADERRYDYAAAMLNTLGFRRIVLLTNNPAKIEALNRAGIQVTERQPLTGMVTAQNLHYLHTKARRANHMLDELLELAEPAAEPGG
jgi:GTP cyclohydrolase II